MGKNAVYLIGVVFFTLYHPNCLGDTSVNMIRNGSFEASAAGGEFPKDWQQYGEEGAVLSKDSATEGEHSLKIHIPEGKRRTAGVVQSMQAEPNTKYEASCWVKVDQLEGGGAYFIISVPGVGRVAKVELVGNATSGWVYGRAAFTTPENTTRLEVTCHIYQSEGTVYFDDLRLSKAPEVTIEKYRLKPNTKPLVEYTKLFAIGDKWRPKKIGKKKKEFVYVEYESPLFSEVHLRNYNREGFWPPQALHLVNWNPTKNGNLPHHINKAIEFDIPLSSRQGF